jgi:hypothetical protein
LPVHVPAALLANPEDWHAGTNATVAIASLLLLHLSFAFLCSLRLLPLSFSFSSFLSMFFFFSFSSLRSVFSFLAGKWKVQVACVVEVADEVKNTN